MTNSSSGGSYEARVLAILARAGLRVDHTGYHVMPSYSGDVAEAEKLAKYFNAVQPARSVSSKVKLGWTRDLCSTIERIVSGDSTDQSALQTVFYLRLHGLVVDFCASVEVFRKALAERAPTPGSTLAILAEVLASINGMRNTLSEDEQLWAEYRRHADAHLHQRGYEMQLHQGKLKETFTSKFTAKPYDVLDLEERLKGVVKRYQHESAIADDFARRLRGPAQEVLTTMTIYCSGADE